MNRKRHFLLILVVLVLSLAMSFSLLACNRDTGTTEAKPDEKALVNNGSFIGVESESFPKVPTGWTSAAGSVAGSGTAVSGTDVVSGVINTDTKTFNKVVEDMHLTKEQNPGHVNDAKDSNVLMINNIKEATYRYSSSSVTLEKDSYYKVSVNVKTLDNAKAYIYVLGMAFAEFEQISTNSWKNYEVYIKSSNSSNQSITIALSNGWGDRNGKLSKGAVFFDEVKVDKITEAEYNTGAAKVKPGAQDSNVNTVAKYDINSSDSEFDYVSGIYNPYTASKYRGYRGYGDDVDYAPNNTSYTNFGIIDTSDKSKFNELSLSKEKLGIDINVHPSTVGTKMLYINNLKPTAYGFKSADPYVVEPGATYIFSALIMTAGISDSSQGATLRIVDTNAPDKKDDAKEYKNINTNGNWERYTFTITSDQLKNKDLGFELWLGEGGVGSANWRSGAVFMDQVTFGKKVTAPTALASDTIPEHNIDISFEESFVVENNLIDNGYFVTDGNLNNDWKNIPTSDDFDFVLSDKDFHKVILGSSANGTLPSDKILINNTDPKNPIYQTKTMQIHLENPGAYGFYINNNGADLIAKKNSFYKFSMFVKADLAKEYSTKGLTVRLMKRADTSKDADAKDTEVASFANINTTATKEVNNGFVQVVFYVEGSNVDASELYFEIKLGSGSKFTPETHVKGDAYITLVSMEKISHDDYVKASTSNYTKKASLATSPSSTSALISNADFTNPDMNATYSNYDKKVQDKDVTIIDENGEVVVPTAPLSWTISNRDYLQALTTGIVSSEKQFNNISDSLKNTIGSSYESFLGNPSNKGALVIATKTKEADSNGMLTVPTHPSTCGCTCKKCIERGYCDGTCGDECNGEHKCLHKQEAGILPVGYSSNSISLSANSYYMISVKVKVGASNAYIYLDNNQKAEPIIVGNTNNEWQTKRFFVNTGLSSTSVKLELYLGDKNNKTMINSGVVAFDNASIVTIDEDIFNEAKNTTPNLCREFITDSFNVTDASNEGLTTPNNWTGSAVTDGSSDKTKVVQGVFDKSFTRNDWLYTTIDGIDTPLDATVYSFLSGDDTDKNFLTINNVVKNGYSFTNSSSSKNLAKNGYYEISVKAMTYGLKNTENAYIILKLNDVTYELPVNTASYNEDGSDKGFADNSKWTEYKFLVKTPENTQVNNVTITLGLGKKATSKDAEKKDENFVQGYAFFDDVTFKNSTKEVFEAQTEDTKFVKKVAATDKELIDGDKKEEEEKEEPKPDTSYLWLYITSGVIAGIILIVVIVILVRKNMDKIKRFFNKRKSGSMASYDKNNTTDNADTKKKTKKSRDDFKDKD